MAYQPTPSLKDDAPFGIATDQVSPAGLLVDEVAADQADEGDIGIARMSAFRIALAELRTQTGDSAMDDTNDAVRVNIVAGSSSGIQYTEGDVDASVTGTAVMWEDAGNTLATVKATNPLPVVEPDRTASGTIAVINDTVAVDTNGMGSALFEISGVYSGALLFYLISEAGIEVTAFARRLNGGAFFTDTYAAGTSGSDEQYLVSVAGSKQFLVKGTIIFSGSATVSIRVSHATLAQERMIPGTGVSDLGKAEDGVHVSGSTGVMNLGVRNDTRGTLAGTDGDYTPFQVNANGDLRTEPFSLGAAASLGKAEDAAHASGDIGVMALAVRRDVLAPTTDTVGDYQTLTVDQYGRLHVFDRAMRSEMKNQTVLLMEILKELQAGGTSIGS